MSTKGRIVKEHLKSFLKMDYNTEFTFYCDKGEAENILQQMRVKLSRLRAKAIAAKLVPAEFKMLVVKKGVNAEGKEFITLTKKTSAASHIQHALESLADEDFNIVVGKRI